MRATVNAPVRGHDARALNREICSKNLVRSHLRVLASVEIHPTAHTSNEQNTQHAHYNQACWILEQITNAREARRVDLDWARHCCKVRQMVYTALNNPILSYHPWGSVGVDDPALFRRRPVRAVGLPVIRVACIEPRIGRLQTSSRKSNKINQTQSNCMQGCLTETCY